MSSTSSPPPCRTQQLRDLRNRQEVYETLKQASHLEHGLSCLYQFAAFSLRKRLSDFPRRQRDTAAKRRRCELILNQNRLWAKSILFVARQEMEHLGIDQNLINAIGMPPYLLRPNFPVPGNRKGIDIPYHLERFGRRTITRFARFEKPEYLEWPAETGGGGGKCAEVFWASRDPLLRAEYDYPSVEDLYESLMEAFKTLPPGELFVGNSEKQVVWETVQFEGSVFTLPVYNRQTAQAAIEQVVEQGEGVGLAPSSPDSHFERFAKILAELDDAGRAHPDHDVALPVLCNPNVEGRWYHLSAAQRRRSNVVTAEPARQLMVVFNDAYNLMVAMLQDFFHSFRGFYGSFPTFAHQARNQALNNAAFFPFMTMVIRPLGELIMRIDAGREYEGRTAGPSFQLRTSAPNRYVEIPLEADLVHYLERFDALLREIREARRLVRRQDRRELSPFLTKREVREQLRALEHDVERMRGNFENDWTSATGVSI